MRADAVVKFPFDNVFDDEPTGEPAAKRTKEPTFSVAELEAARQAAHAEGVAAGLAEAREGYERRAAQALEEAARQIASLHAVQAGSNVAVRRNAIEVAVTVVRKLFPRVEARWGLAEVEQVVQDSLTQLFEEPRVVIRVHDSLLEALQGRLEALAQSAGYPGRLILIADDTIGPGDCRVEWADGGAERLGERLWRDIDAVLQRALGVPSDSAARWLTAAEPSTEADDEAQSAGSAAAPAPPEAEAAADDGRPNVSG
jgi:flagellar assembly protein FliH